MAEESAPAGRAETPREVSAAEYAAFISQIELLAVWLKMARVVNHHGPKPPLQALFTVADDATWEPSPDGFRVYHHYNVRVVSDEAPLAEMEVTFGLDFQSAEPPSDRLFAVFREVNLPVNTWPYLREFVGTMTARMNWLTTTLPTLKRGVDEGSETTATRETPSSAERRSRRGRRKS